MSRTTYATDRINREEANTLLGNSSGIILTENDEGITIGYVDFDVSEFGGRDFECFYKLDPPNAELFVSALKKKYDGDLFDMCVKAFSIKFSSRIFEDFCRSNGISYEKNMY